MYIAIELKRSNVLYFDTCHVAKDKHVHTLGVQAAMKIGDYVCSITRSIVGVK